MFGQAGKNLVHAFALNKTFKWFTRTPKICVARGASKLRARNDKMFFREGKIPLKNECEQTFF